MTKSIPGYFWLGLDWDTSVVNIYLFKVNNRNTRKRFELCSKLAIKIPERRQWRHSGVFVVNFEHISHRVSIIGFEQVNFS